LIEAIKLVMEVRREEILSNVPKDIIKETVEI